MSENQQKLVLAIIDFLNGSLQDVKTDDREGLEVANPSNEQQKQRLSVKPANLQTIFDVFLKTKEKVGAPGAASSSSSTGSTVKTPSAADKADAEKQKQAGNAFMSSKDWDKAIDSYTKAIQLDGTNPVYFSNRAAAHTSKGDHLSAVGDAEQAIALDDKFVKAYHRLGHAQYSLADYTAAASAFERGLKLDPTNANLKSGLENANARITIAEKDATTGSPDAATGAAPGLGGLPDMLRNMGGAGGAGGMPGMPDLSSMMSNPSIMAAAQQMAASGGLENLMRNPAVMNMMNRMQSGGGMPNMAELMSDPTLRDLASQFGVQDTPP